MHPRSALEHHFSFKDLRNFGVCASHRFSPGSSDGGRNETQPNYMTEAINSLEQSIKHIEASLNISPHKLVKLKENWRIRDSLEMSREQGCSRTRMKSPTGRSFFH